MDFIRNKLAHTLNAVKGWPQPWSVDLAAPMSANVTIPTIYSGRVAHLNASSELEMGVHDVAMPVFLFSNSDDLDVDRSAFGNPATDEDAYVGVTPSGKLACIPARHSCELESTEYDTGETYTPLIALTATASNSNATTGGVLKPGTLYLESCCGVVSRGVVKSGYGPSKTALAFWPWHYPKLLKATITAINAT
jgi:hypothetical protein